MSIQLSTHELIGRTSHLLGKIIISPHLH